MEKNAEKKIRSSAENSTSTKVDKVPNKSENIAINRGNTLESKFVSKKCYKSL